MTPELQALYEIHRHQLLINAIDSSGGFRVPPSYLYAIDRRIFPYLHQEWCAGEDPYLPCYQVSKELITEVVGELNRQSLETDEEIPTFYELERKYGRGKRAELIGILRYCFLDEYFDSDVYDRILAPAEHPTEASGICREYSADDIYLI